MSNALSIMRAARSKRPVESLEEDARTGDYIPRRNEDDYVARPGTVRGQARTIRGVNALQRERSLAKFSAPKLTPRADNYAQFRNPDGSPKVSKEVTVASSGGGTKTIPAKPAPEVGGSAKTARPPLAAAAKPVRKEGMIDGKPSSQYFREAANRQGQGNAYTGFKVPAVEEKAKAIAERTTPKINTDVRAIARDARNQAQTAKLFPAARPGPVRETTFERLNRANTPPGGGPLTKDVMEGVAGAAKALERGKLNAQRFLGAQEVRAKAIEDEEAQNKRGIRPNIQARNTGSTSSRRA